MSVTEDTHDEECRCSFCLGDESSVYEVNFKDDEPGRRTGAVSKAVSL